MMLAAVFIWNGCGQQEPAAPPSEDLRGAKAAKAPALPIPATEAEVPVATPPPPAVTGAASHATTTATVAVNREMQDDEGKPITVVQYVQRAVDAYERMRYASVEGDKPPWPPLQDLSQLVKVGILKTLPPAPAGEKFVLDPRTQKVSLAGQ